MFAVIFEVAPKAEHWDGYLHHAGLLRPDLVQIDGFLANERYASLQRDGWVLSLSIWRNEKAVVRWRTFSRHHDSQEAGRNKIFADYHLRVGEITGDTGLKPGEMLAEERFDETETGAAKHIALAEQTIGGLPEKPDVAELAAQLGLPAAKAQGELADWDVFRHLQRPDDYLLLSSWRSSNAAAMAGAAQRKRTVRVIRDYGMFDRREAPQYYPPVERAGR